MASDNRQFYARITISREQIEAAMAEERLWMRQLAALNLSTAQKRKYMRRAQGSRFMRRVVQPEIAAMLKDMHQWRIAATLNQPSHLQAMLDPRS